MARSRLIDTIGLSSSIGAVDTHETALRKVPVRRIFGIHARFVNLVVGAMPQMVRRRSRTDSSHERLAWSQDILFKFPRKKNAMM